MNDWSPPNPDHPPPKADEPPLFLAARTGDHDAIHRLVSQGASLDALYDIGLDPGARPNPCTPLMVAAGSGDGATIETVRLLLSLGADPRRVAPYGSAAKRACEGLGWNYRPGGDAERFRVLLAAGSPLVLTGRDGARLVADTARTGDAERLGVLIDAGAPVNPVFDPVLAKKEWAQASACMFGNRCGEQPATDDDGIECEVDTIARDMFREMNEQLASAPSSSETPLMCAAMSGNAACVQMLLKAGAHINAIDNMRYSPLFHAGSPDVVHALVASGINFRHVDDRGKDALQHVLEEMGAGERDPIEQGAICAAMVQAGIPLVKTTEECHRLYDAAFAENLHAVRWLLEAGHGSVPRGDGATALHAICWHWDYDQEELNENTRDIVRALLNAGVDPCARNSCGNTPLHEAVAGDGTNLVAAIELLKAGADINAQNNDAQTPLVFFYETLFDYATVVPFLLQHGANPLIPNSRGKNAIDIARQMIAGENPDWRTEQWCEEGEPPCGWKDPAQPGDEEHQMLDLLVQAAERFRG